MRGILASAAFDFFFRMVSAILMLGIVLPGNIEAREDKEALTVNVLVSLRIRPYVTAVEGFAREIETAGAVLRVHYLDDPSGPSARLPKSRASDVAVAVGPEAGRFLARENGTSRPIFFMMILDPEEVLAPAGLSCGVSLHIPVSLQTREISRCLPEVEKLGILFSPEHNSPFVEEASRSASDLPVSIVPLPVPTPRRIPEVLQSGWETIDALWLIPDRTVISESLVHFILKEALLQGVPVIGFNRFFHESGALLSFVIDYEAVGRKAARLVLEKGSEGTSCPAETPPFHIWLNDRVRERLGMDTAEPERGLPKTGP